MVANRWFWPVDHTKKREERGTWLQLAICLELAIEEIKCCDRQTLATEMKNQTNMKNCTPNKKVIKRTGTASS